MNQIVVLAKDKKIQAEKGEGIHKKAVITCPAKKAAAYKKLFSAKTGFEKSMKIK